MTPWSEPREFYDEQGRLVIEDDFDEDDELGFDEGWSLPDGAIEAAQALGASTIEDMARTIFEDRHHFPWRFALERRRLLHVRRCLPDRTAARRSTGHRVVRRARAHRRSRARSPARRPSTEP